MDIIILLTVLLMGITFNSMMSSNSLKEESQEKISGDDLKNKESDKYEIN